jgi:hypothetical protein
MCPRFQEFYSGTYPGKMIPSKDMYNNIHNSPELAGHQWLMPVILATWEAEIRRI